MTIQETIAYLVDALGKLIVDVAMLQERVRKLEGGE